MIDGWNKPKGTYVGPPKTGSDEVSDSIANEGKGKGKGKGKGR